MHKHRPYYTYFRNKLKKLKLLDNLLMSGINLNRVRRARVALKELNAFPDFSREILLDYSYSIKHTHRSISQVLNIEAAIHHLAENNIMGALVETGVFTGGCSAYILRSAMRNLSNDLDKFSFWGFDSFEGMPSPTHHDGDHGHEWIYGKGHYEVREKSELVGHNTNIADFDLTMQYLKETNFPPDNLNLVKGWFQHTLPVHKDQIGPIALLRLDGDFYDSTITVLEHLYEQVVPGGLIIIDDYGAFEGCKKAVDEYLYKHRANVNLIYVDNSIRYFIKPK